MVGIEPYSIRVETGKEPSGGNPLYRDEGNLGPVNTQPVTHEDQVDPHFDVNAFWSQLQNERDKLNST